MRYESPHRNRVGQDMRDKPFKCRTCGGLSFVSERGLKNHQNNNRIHHELESLKTVDRNCLT